MRESFGGAFMIKLVLIFIVLYISLMAAAVTYAKGFRVKNNVINMLEQNQFVLTDDTEFIDNYLAQVPYNYGGEEYQSVKEHCANTADEDGSTGAVLTERGVCITGKSTGNNNSEIYYKVTSYISISLPLFKLNLTLPISGETKVIRY